MFDDIALFIHIVQAQGLVGASKVLNIPPATVTRRLKKLEEKLGCQLIHRSARQFRLTAEGEVYYQSFSDLVTEFEAKTRGLSHEMETLNGSLTVLAPTNISIGFAQPMWTEFIRQYPDIQLSLKLNNENKDIIEEQADIALRAGPQKDSRLYQLKVGSVSTFLVASPDYLSQSSPLHDLEDLYHHRCITVAHLPVWKFQNRRTGDKATIRQRSALKVDDINIASQFARDGLGLALLPATEVYEQLKSGELVIPLDDWFGPQRDLYLIWPSGRLLGAKARVFKEHAQQYLENALERLGSFK
ncbi:putative Transcriptional regulator, LysR family [Vibrio nigripulchritudo MADA3029]|uniref:LysR family transcriptional regulator n=1 Tax=Vibrio nigripulchritudo TaxID=28173 RepID=UPI0003B20582|nr:LysR family transcriptional regulator [Vibrio nigripulchritudo]CCN46510.1 putative Transcriptional regulator, LysR family [Vibrio nigripulchritudo MADA3020]CCN53916.1 putative Transcriptional regulator, LysR family [Vibrio nigripulchritudo MADA3021]CCN62454.1 putative Transcriptional regulator, LysR family [Vibrio nigripulchritudo MADA3029]